MTDSIIYTAGRSECAHVHLTCPGISDQDEPSASRLLLHDHAADPLTVMDISRLDLTGAWLAYLSTAQASHGAAGTGQRPDRRTHRGRRLGAPTSIQVPEPGITAPCSLSSADHVQPDCIIIWHQKYAVAPFLPVHR